MNWDEGRERKKRRDGKGAGKMERRRDRQEVGQRRLGGSLMKERERLEK